MHVELISYTPNPLGVIASAKGLMRGTHTKPDDFSEEEKLEAFADSAKTALLSPFEFVNFVFDFTGVSRAFTHQLVRTRMASYVQESMRFSAKTGEQFEYYTPSDDVVFKGDEIGELWNQSMQSIQQSYENLISAGAKVESARGVLPTNILTSVVMGIDYRNLLQMCDSRLCFQTQGEHREAMLEIKRLFLDNPELLKMGEFLAPVCEHTGYCPWESKYDRPCPKQAIYPFRSEVLHHSKEIKKYLKTVK